METQNNNLTPELSELRNQLATFKQRLDNQQIVNDRLLRRSMKARISPFPLTSIITDGIALIISPLIFVAFNRMGVHWGFGAFIILMILIELCYNIYSYYHINKLFTQPNDIVTMRRGLLQFRRAERIWMSIAIPSILLWVLLVWWQAGALSHFQRGLVYGIIGLVIGLVACFSIYAWQMRRVRQVERELDELSE